MVKKILFVFLFVVSAVLAFMVYDSIDEKIKYDAKVEEVNLMVQNRLDTLRRIELAYKDMHGVFAGDFEKLFHFMNNEKYWKVKEVGDNDGEVVDVTRDTTFLDPKVFLFNNPSYNVEHLKMVPPSDTAQFEIFADFILQGNVPVPVYEIKDPYPFDKDGKALKIGDRNSAVTGGNWK